MKKLYQLLFVIVPMTRHRHHPLANQTTSYLHHLMKLRAIMVHPTRVRRLPRVLGITIAIEEALRVNVIVRLMLYHVTHYVVAVYLLHRLFHLMINRIVETVYQLSIVISHQPWGDVCCCRHSPRILRLYTFYLQILLPRRLTVVNFATLLNWTLMTATTRVCYLCSVTVAEARHRPACIVPKNNAPSSWKPSSWRDNQLKSHSTARSTSLFVETSSSTSARRASNIVFPSDRRVVYMVAEGVGAPAVAAVTGSQVGKGWTRSRRSNSAHAIIFRPRFVAGRRCSSPAIGNKSKPQWFTDDLTQRLTEHMATDSG